MESVLYILKPIQGNVSPKYIQSTPFSANKKPSSLISRDEGYPRYHPFEPISYRIGHSFSITVNRPDLLCFQSGSSGTGSIFSGWKIFQPRIFFLHTINIYYFPSLLLSYTFFIILLYSLINLTRFVKYL